MGRENENTVENEKGKNNGKGIRRRVNGKGSEKGT
jgi:hypothetical protein